MKESVVLNKLVKRKFSAKLISTVIVIVASFVFFPMNSLLRWVGLGVSRETTLIPQASIFEFAAEDISGNTISLQSFKGKKAYLVLNVASK